MIKAKLISKKQNDEIAALKFCTASKQELFMVAIGIASKLELGEWVDCEVKSSDVIVSKTKLKDCSLSNEIECVIKEMEVGEILTSLVLGAKDFTLNSIITSNSARRLNLKLEERVYAYIKATQIYIKERLC